MFMKMISGAVFALLLSVGAASASSVAGSSSGVFTGEDAGNPGCGIFGCFGTDEAAISGDGKTLSWPSEGCFIGCVPLPNQSTLTINDGPFNEALSFGSNAVTVASLTWTNAASLLAADNFNAFATLGVNYTFPGVAGGTENITFNITNTANPTGDIIDPSLAVGPLDFGQVLPLSLGSGVSILGYSVYADGDGSFVGGVWRNREHGTSTLYIVADVNVVPLPASSLMLLGGVGGLAVMRRRQKKNKS